jgi:hypothetical protein
MKPKTSHAHAVQIRFRSSGEIEVDDDVDGLDVDAAGEEVRADEVACHAVSEVVENAVPVGLHHLGVRVEARVAELGDLLCEELDSVGRVTEDDGLVDLELEGNQQELMNCGRLSVPWRRVY